jgi:hypothetical protein
MERSGDLQFNIDCESWSGLGIYYIMNYRARWDLEKSYE